MRLHRLMWAPTLVLLAACGNDASTDTSNDASSGSNEASISQDMLYGRWAAEPTWCQEGQEGAPITLAQGRFEGRENRCDMALEESDEPHTWQATLSCQGEGMTSEERLQLILESDNTLTLTYLDRDRQQISLSRCD
ncbi:hypothetical protein [Vreelandella lionensis]|uniref:hypothetical protein n=1 Tax=Halomonadaceae TaxID=28256 RepID=UPI0009F3D00E|nr:MULTISPECIES: hypothetical protein [Halomonas]MCP1316217.1 hypothetical protein [Halomonas sp. 707B3]